jgi:hypothetical protein
MDISLMIVGYVFVRPFGGYRFDNLSLLKFLFSSWVQAMRLIFRFSIIPNSEGISKTHGLEGILSWI